MADDFPALIRSLLTPLAERYGLDYGIETLVFHEQLGEAAVLAEATHYSGPAIGTSDEAIAFGLVTCGGELLSGYRERGDIPTTSKRAAKRASKWVNRSFRTDEGRTAAIFLAQAFGVEMSRLMGLHGFPDRADFHLELVELVQRHYPLSEPMRATLLAEALAEYDVLETRELPDIHPTGFPPTGFHTALMDGIEPDDELVEIQASFAGQYFRHMAGFSAIRLAIGEKRYAAIAGDLIPPGFPAYEDVIHARIEGRWWVDVGEHWQQVAARYTGRERGGEHPVD